MFSNVALSVSHLSKQFKLYERPADRLWESLGLLRRPVKTFHALSDVAFELKKGEVLGIIGRNGAGKSTLLQLICGTLRPTSGSVQVTGRIAALLELGSGFNPEFSGRDNVYLNASVLGLSKAEIDARFDDIVAFSELEAFIDQPVKTYSSGMFVRLAFAVATSVDPDILVIDEALSVGDGAFAKKSFDRIMTLKDKGVTILFCSHSLYQVEALCDKAIWLKDGQLQLIGDTKLVSMRYQDFLSSMDLPLIEKKTQIPNNVALSPYQIKHVELTGYQHLNDENQPVFASEIDNWQLELTLLCATGAATPTLGIIIYTTSGQEVTSFSSKENNINFLENASITLSVEKFPLLKGRYYVDIFILCDQGIHVYEHLRYLTPFEVSQSHLEIGLVRLARNWHIETHI